MEICATAFTHVLGEHPNQVSRQRDDVSVGAKDLLAVASADGSVTRVGVESNVYVGLAYLTAWLGGSGAAAIRNLMEDVATAEISRSQLWQQIRQGVKTSDTGETVSADMVRTIIDEQSAVLEAEVGPENFARYGSPAQELLTHLVTSESYDNFLTDSAYEKLSGVPSGG